MLFSLFSRITHPLEIKLSVPNKDIHTPRYQTDKHLTCTPPCPALLLTSLQKLFGVFLFLPPNLCVVKGSNLCVVKGSKACYPVELIQRAPEQKLGLLQEGKGTARTRISGVCIIQKREGQNKVNHNVVPWHNQPCGRLRNSCVCWHMKVRMEETRSPGYGP